MHIHIYIYRCLLINLFIYMPPLPPSPPVPTNFMLVALLRTQITYQLIHLQPIQSMNTNVNSVILYYLDSSTTRIENVNPKPRTLNPKP